MYLLFCHYRFLLFLSALISLCVSYESYQNKIPNGRSVPHPCKPNYIWYGVGHQKVLGSGSRNPFGEAFAMANHVRNKLIFLIFYLHSNICRGRNCKPANRFLVGLNEKVKVADNNLIRSGLLLYLLFT